MSDSEIGGEPAITQVVARDRSLLARTGVRLPAEVDVASRPLINNRAKVVASPQP